MNENVLEMLRTHSVKECDRLLRRQRIQKALSWSGLFVFVAVVAYLAVTL